MKKLTPITAIITFLLSTTPAFATITNNAINIPASSPGEGFAFIVGQVWKTVVIVGGVAFLIYFIMGGIDRVTAGGDKVKVENSTKKITNALIGLVILVGSYAVAAFIGSILKIDLLNITWPSL